MKIIETHIGYEGGFISNGFCTIYLTDERYWFVHYFTGASTYITMITESEAQEKIDGARKYITKHNG